MAPRHQPDQRGTNNALQLHSYAAVPSRSQTMWNQEGITPGSSTRLPAGASPPLFIRINLQLGYDSCEILGTNLREMPVLVKGDDGLGRIAEFNETLTAIAFAQVFEYGGELPARCIDNFPESMGFVLKYQ